MKSWTCATPEIQVTASAATVAQELAQAGQRIALSEARRLLAWHLNCSAAWLVTHAEAPLSAADTARFRACVAQRAAGTPVAYLTGQREFYGRDFSVSADVLIPRPETELLVDLAKHLTPPPYTVLDLGTGSGCLAITLALELPAATVWAVEYSPAALAQAQANALALKADVHFLRSDWFAALPKTQRFDLIVANPPYIAAGDAHLAQGDVRFEPTTALVGGGDGLSCLRQIIAVAPQFLRQGGLLAVEHGYDQGPRVAALFAKSGFESVQQQRDLAGIVRVTYGTIACEKVC